ncbi:MAG: anhydro-N-acetylmuramic acid kinase [bacterium]|nr:anhydro-N-acetylmuramic acid kinase [bacterium]
MLIVGLMSGTSADGIDAALCEISGTPPKIEARVIQSCGVPYPDGFQSRVHAACLPGKAGADELCRLNADIGEQFAQSAQAVIEAAGLTPAQIDLIGSHGQTVWHDVVDGRVTSTLQLGEAAIIAERTGITTISNFRPRDVAVGGQGAPLTAYADWLLLRHESQWRAVQNIGGIGNVTFLPPLSDNETPPLAFDTGPGNALIDGAVNVLTKGAQTYDADGKLAATGKVSEKWLRVLMEEAYLQRQPPKTTGRELFGTAMIDRLVKTGRGLRMPHEDIIATLTAYTAASIADAYQRFAPGQMAEVIIGGGGARNPTLLAMLQERLAPARVVTHEAIGLSSDFKEALVFALLAHETWHNRPGNLPALTGASIPVVLGQITPGANYAALLQKTWCTS